MEPFAITLVCVGWWTLTWSALLADIQSIGNKKFADEHYRHDLGAAMFLAAIPITWLLHPFLTGFYEHGLQFGRRTY